MGRVAAGALSALAVLLASATPARAEDAPTGPLVLTFDTEVEADVPAIEALDPPAPSTFFVTGEFAEAHEAFVRRLSARHEIGVHTYDHPHLHGMAADRQEAQLAGTARILARITGRTTFGFRAPYFEYDDRTLDVLSEAPFVYDSSDWEGKTDAQARVVEVPVASRVRGREPLAAADYSLFSSGTSDADALAFLIECYEARAREGRACVFLFHPHLALEHRAVYDGLVAHVRGRGGRFDSIEGYLRSLRTPPPRRLALWVSFTQGRHDPETVVRDAASLGATDLFVEAKSADTGPTFGSSGHADGADRFGDLARAARAAGLRVHGWFAVARSVADAKAHPEWAMVDTHGQRLADWICVNRPAARARLLDEVREFVRTVPSDGVQLDYLRYPGVETCACDACREAFFRRTGVRFRDHEDLFRDHYGEWVAFRVDTVTGFARDVRAVLHEEGRDDLVLSAALRPDGALGPEGRDDFGQSYEDLAGVLDMAVPMAYHREARQPPAWIRRVALGAKIRFGRKPVLVGVEAYRDPSRGPYGVGEFADALARADGAGDGVALFSYLHLMRRGDPAHAMPEGAVAAVAALGSREGAHGPTPPRPPARSLPWAWAGVAALLLVTVVLATRRRSRRPPPREPVTVARDGAGALFSVHPLSRLPGTDASVIASALLALGSAGIDALRGADLVLRLGRRGTVALTSSEESAAQRAATLGWLTRTDSDWVPTPAGLAILERERRFGDVARRRLALERRIFETLVSRCPSCGGRVETSWMTARFHCPACGRETALGEVDLVEVVSSGPRRGA